MTSAIDSIVDILETGSAESKRDAIAQLVVMSNVSIAPIAQALKRKLAPEMATLIRRNLSLLASEDSIVLFQAAEALESFGYHVLDFIQADGSVLPDNILAKKIVTEIHAFKANVGDSFVSSTVSLDLRDLAEESVIGLTKLHVTVTDEDRDRIPALEKVLAFLEINGDARRRAKAELLNLGEIAIEPLAYALNSEEPIGRRYAAQVLSLVHSERAVRPLLDGLRDTDVFVVSTIVDALSRKGNDVLLPMASLLAGLLP